MTKRLNWKKNQTLKNGSRILSLLSITIGMLILSNPSNAQNICRIKTSPMDATNTFIYVGPKGGNGAVGGDYPCDAKLAISLEDDTKHIHSSASPYNSTLTANGNIDHPSDGTGTNGKRAFDKEVTYQQIHERVTNLKPGYIEGSYGMKWTLKAEQLKTLYPSSTFDVQYQGEQRTLIDYQNLFFEMLVMIQLQAKQSDEQMAIIEQQAASIEQLNERLQHIENTLNINNDFIAYKNLGEVNIYPNPITNSIIQVDYQINQNVSNVQLTVTDIQGKKVYENLLNASHKKGNQAVNIDLPSGTYLYYLENGTQQTNAKKLMIL